MPHNMDLIQDEAFSVIITVTSQYHYDVKPHVEVYRCGPYKSLSVCKGIITSANKSNNWRSAPRTVECKIQRTEIDWKDVGCV